MVNHKPIKTTDKLNTCYSNLNGDLSYNFAWLKKAPS